MNKKTGGLVFFGVIAITLYAFGVKFFEAIWSFPSFSLVPLMVFALLGTGIFITFYLGFPQIRYFKHGLKVTRGVYDDPNEPGDLNHFQALTTALSATVGIGNIAGVATALYYGGPGALFWMWITAFFGSALKYAECTLAVEYRDFDSQGMTAGGPMYTIEKGLGIKWRWLAIIFACFAVICSFATGNAIQSFTLSDQLYSEVTQMVGNDHFLTVKHAITDSYNVSIQQIINGIIIAGIAGMVIIGGIKRIAKVASKMVPIMVGVYLIAAIFIIGKNIYNVPTIFSLIIQDAFSGNAIAGGAIGTMISIGVRRGLFSNEAGSGTETMAHGAAKTKEPVREGLVAMLGPFIDTIIVCSITAIVILLSGVYTQDLNGVSITVSAFEHELGTLGKIAIIAAVLTISLSTMFGYSYYGRKCTSYLFGTKWKIVYNWFYIMMIVLASTISIDIAINFMDSAFALMVIPTIISTILLAPKVLDESKRYFNQI